MSGDAPEVLLAAGDPLPRGHRPRCLSAVESAGQPEDQPEDQPEEEDGGRKKEGDGSHAAPLRRSGAFRVHGHSYDPFKRHSWGPDRERQDPLST